MTTLSYDSFINPATLAAIKADRLGLYADQARDFLRAQFPDRLAHLNDAVIEELVLQSYDRARRAGLHSEQELLLHLIVVVLWGSEFASNPAFAGALKDANWPSNQGYGGVGRIHSLIRHLSRWQTAVRSDLDQPKRIISGFQRLFFEGDSGRVDVAQTADWLHFLWPARTALIAPKNLASFIDLSLSQRPLSEPVDAVAHVALGGYFGAFFTRDPLYPWARSAYLLDDDLPAMRLALGAGVQSHWSALEKEYAS